MHSKATWTPYLEQWRNIAAESLFDLAPASNS